MLVFAGAYPKRQKMSVAGQFAAVKNRSERYCWTQKLNRKDQGEDKNWVLLAVVFCSV
jgi:hypothetical protein